MAATHTFQNLALPSGSLILVTGANGYIASHVVDQLLQLGYRVRGTTRGDRPWLNDFFIKKYGKACFETMIVEDMTSPTAFDLALQGVKGVVLVASDMSLKPQADEVITSVVEATGNALKAAARSHSVEQVVLTSSSAALSFPKPLQSKVVLTETTYNQEAVDLAWSPPPHSAGHGFLVYAASKTEAERSAWEFIKKNKPDFTFNTVIPSVTIGSILDPDNMYGSSGRFIRDIYIKDDTSMFQLLKAHWYVDVVDVARLHVAALLNPAIKSERLFGYAETVTQSSILGILRKLKPEHKWPENPTDEVEDKNEVPGAGRAENILQEFFGVRGWKPLEESVKELFKDLF